MQTTPKNLWFKATTFFISQLCVAGAQGIRKAVLVLPGPAPAAVFNQRLSRKLNSVGTLGWSGLALWVVFPLAGGKTRQALSQGPPVFQISTYQASVVRWCPMSQWSHAAKPKVSGGGVGVGFIRSWTSGGRVHWGPLTQQDPKAWFHFLEFTRFFSTLGPLHRFLL